MYQFHPSFVHCTCLGIDMYSINYCRTLFSQICVNSTFLPSVYRYHQYASISPFLSRIFVGILRVLAFSTFSLHPFILCRVKFRTYERFKKKFLYWCWKLASPPKKLWTTHGGFSLDADVAEARKWGAETSEIRIHFSYRREKIKIPPTLLPLPKPKWSSWNPCDLVAASPPDRGWCGCVSRFGKRD